MFIIKNTYKYKDIQKTSMKENTFYVLKNPETNCFFSIKEGVSETIDNASKYKTVGILKSIINKTFFPKESIILHMIADTNVFEERRLPPDTFDNFDILEIKEV